MLNTSKFFVLYLIQPDMIKLVQEIYGRSLVYNGKFNFLQQ